MRSGTIAFLLGVMALWECPGLPSTYFAPALVLVVLVCRGIPLVVGFGLGFGWAWVNALILLGSGLPDVLMDEPCRVEGEVISLPEVRREVVRFYFQVERTLDCSARWHGKTRVSWYRTDVQPQAGQRWRLLLQLRPPRGLANPGGFDYERWLFARRIRAVAYVRPSPRNQLVGAGSGLVNALRQDFNNRIAGALANHSEGALIAALSVGHRGGISPRQWETMRATGTTHLMVISGLHIGLLWTVGFLATRWLASRTLSWCASAAPVQWATGAGVLCAVAYALLAGFTIPTQRALVMVLVAASGALMTRRVGLDTVYLTALLAVLLVDPLAPLQSGFWLSFGAVALIFLSVHSVANEGKLSKLWHRWCRLQVILSLGLAPMTLFYFQGVSLLSPVANTLAIPWVGFVVVPVTLFGGVLSCLWLPGAEFVWYLSAELLHVLWVVLEWLQKWQVEPVLNVQFGKWSLVAALLGVALILAPRGFPARWLGIVPLGLLMVNGPGVPAGQLLLTVLDVGQGLAVVARTPSRTLVYDTGPAYGHSDAGQRVVEPYLRSSGVMAIDRLIVSHSDLDHSGGSVSLIERFPVGQVLGEPGIDAISAVACRYPQHWIWDDVEFRILHPGPADTLKGNDSSCVLRISVGRTSILLPGDIETSGEEALLRRVKRQALASEVLIAPHHGSKSSSTRAFVEAVDPRLVVFSAGYRNRWHLPDDSVVERYQSLGVEVASTALHGAVQVVVLGDGTIDTVQFERREHPRIWHIHSDRSR